MDNLISSDIMPSAQEAKADDRKKVLRISIVNNYQIFHKKDYKCNY